MKKYVALYLAPAAAIAEMMKLTPEQGKAEMDAWMAWHTKHKASIVDIGAPLGKTTRVTTKGVADARNEITGYSVVQAESREAAAKMFADHPHFHAKDAYIDVMDWVDVTTMMPG